jgi:glucose-6-phosphate 1-dehydrogenase
MTVEEQSIQRQRVGVRPGDPCTLVIFGAAGDLTKRLLIPSLYNLHASKLLPEKFAVVGVTAAAFRDEDFREKLTRDIQEFGRSRVQKELWDWLRARIYYHSGDFREPNLYKQLKDKLAAVDKQQGTPGSYLVLSGYRTSVFRRNRQATRCGRAYGGG